MTRHELKEIRRAMSELPEYPQLNDIMECFNKIDKILRAEGY